MSIVPTLKHHARGPLGKLSSRSWDKIITITDWSITEGSNELYELHSECAPGNKPGKWGMNVRCALDFQMDLNCVQGERKHFYYQSRKARNPGEKFWETCLKMSYLFQGQNGPLRKRAPGFCLGESPKKQVSTGIENCTDLTVLPMHLSSVPQSGMDGIISN